VFFTFHKTSHLNEEVKCTEPFPSDRLPCPTTRRVERNEKIGQYFEFETFFFGISTAENKLERLLLNKIYFIVVPKFAERKCLQGSSKVFFCQ
jgi:hypothetical protein